MPKPLIVAHRGDTKNAPENTLPAFASAIQKGADGIELDVHWSKDGLSHAKKLHPRLRTGTFFLQPPTWMPLRLAQRHVIDWATLFEIQVTHLHLSLLTDDFVDELRRCGLTVYVSNLSTKEDIEQGLGKEIDSFSTDELELALQIRDEFQ